MRLGLGIGLNRFRGGQAAPAGILDSYTGAAFAAALDVLLYSSHSVTDNAVGSATNGQTGQYTVRVRRSSDNAVSSFTYTEVSDGTLTTWVGAGNDGFVEAWYEQGTNGNHATQSTAANQPKIVDAGSLVVENGKAALDFDGTNDVMPTTHVLSSAFSILYVGRYDSQVKAVLGNAYLSGLGAGKYVVADIGLGIIGFRSNGTTDASFDRTSLQHLFCAYGTGDGAVTPTLNGVLGTQSTGHETSFSGASQVGGVEGSFERTMSGSVQIIVIYNSDQTSNRTAIESAINTEYSIY